MFQLKYTGNRYWQNYENIARQTECMITKIPLSVAKMAVISDHTHITTLNNSTYIFWKRPLSSFSVKVRLLSLLEKYGPSNHFSTLVNFNKLEKTT